MTLKKEKSEQGKKTKVITKTVQSVIRYVGLYVMQLINNDVFLLHMLHSIFSIIYLYAGIAGIYYNSSFIKYIYLTGRVGVFGLMGISICHLLLMLCVSAERKSNSKRENERAHLTTSLN